MENKNWEIFSNLAIVLAGVFLMWDTSILWGAGVIAMGLGSMHGHWKGDYLFDWMGMYMAYSYQLTFYGVHLEVPLVLTLLPVMLAGTFPLYYFGLRKIKLFTVRGHWIVLGLLWVLTFVGSFWVFNIHAALLSGACYGVAFYIRNNWNHGYWHIIVAIAIVVLTF
jgi:hypothetical protein